MTLRFVDNHPGRQFVIGFLKRHRKLTVRTVGLIKRSRAAVSQDDVNEFFDNFEKVLEGVPPKISSTTMRQTSRRTLVLGRPSS